MFSFQKGELAPHRNIMPCVLFGQGAPITVSSQSRELKAEIVCIMPGVLHSVSIGSGGAEIVYLDGLQLSTDRGELSIVTAEFANVPVAIKNTDAGVVEDFRFALSRPLLEPDFEVLKIVLQLYAAPMERMSQEQLASQLGLERTLALRHFKANTGQTFRKFKIWCASVATVHRVLSGQNIGAAGIDSGFSDAAHVARTARDLFGITPTMGIGALREFKSM